MNMTIGIAEAKARLSEVIDRVESGEIVIIARNGEPVAELRPIRRLSAAETVERIRAIGRRAAKRNEHKDPGPIDTQELRSVAHSRHRC
jgi:prevent-host-death family protein